MQKTAKGKRGSKQAPPSARKESPLTRNRAQTMKISEITNNLNSSSNLIGTKKLTKQQEKMQQKKQQQINKCQKQNQKPQKQDKKQIIIEESSELEEEIDSVDENVTIQPQTRRSKTNSKQSQRTEKKSSLNSKASNTSTNNIKTQNSNENITKIQQQEQVKSGTTAKNSQNKSDSIMSSPNQKRKSFQSAKSDKERIKNSPFSLKGQISMNSQNNPPTLDPYQSQEVLDDDYAFSTQKNIPLSPMMTAKPKQKVIRELNFDFSDSSDAEDTTISKKKPKKWATMVFFKKNKSTNKNEISNGRESDEEDDDNEEENIQLKKENGERVENGDDKKGQLTIVAKTTDEKYPPQFSSEYLKQESTRKCLQFYRQKNRCLTLDHINSISIGPENKLNNIFNLKAIAEGGNYKNNIIEYERNFLPPNVVKKKISCNCKKTQCLKLYCDCFAQGEICKDCNCVDCHNKEENALERQQAMDQLEMRNPSAFRPKVQVNKQEDEENEVVNNKGCNCKKSGCKKKYCECYNTGVKCSDLCKCDQCKNRDPTYLLQNNKNNNNTICKEENSRNIINNNEEEPSFGHPNIQQYPNMSLSGFQKPFNQEASILGMKSFFYNQDFPDQTKKEDSMNNLNEIGGGENSNPQKSRQIVLGGFNMLQNSQDNFQSSQQNQSFNNSFLGNPLTHFQNSFFQQNNKFIEDFNEMTNNNSKNNKTSFKSSNKQQNKDSNINMSIPYSIIASSMFLDNQNEYSNRSQNSQGFIQLGKSKNETIKGKNYIIEKQDD